MREQGRTDDIQLAKSTAAAFVARSREPSTNAALAASRNGRAQVARPRVSAIGLADQTISSSVQQAIRVDSTSFEEWMKMATDNKINASNTWNFALIDYFHDMSLLRSDSGDGTINFQKASCTLDGCIKVWTSRVDSVVVETGRLLNGLQDDLNAGKEKSKKANDGDQEDGAEGSGGEEDEDGSGGKKKKRSKAKESTLAKDFSQIQIKKLELEFTVDPLFKKTSADFDEGGAGGLLMNHLGVDHHARIVFDAGDVAGVAEEDEQAAASADLVDTSVDVIDQEVALTASSAAPGSRVPVEMIDITKLRQKLLEADGAPSAQAPDALAQLIVRRTICPTLAPFRFSNDDPSLFEDLVGGDSDRSVYDQSTDLAPMADFGNGADGMDFYDDLPPMEEGDDAGADFFADAMSGGAGGEMDGEYGEGGGFDDDGGYDDEHGLTTGAMRNGQANSIIPNRNGPNLFMALGDLRNAGDQGEDGAGLLDYFDQQLKRNWAGPEHWKMRRVMPSKGKDDGAVTKGAGQY